MQINAEILSYPSQNGYQEKKQQMLVRMSGKKDPLYTDGWYVN
jgi:hypothetical protein